MHRRRWLVVGLCFCVFTGCKACQSIYDYCGPMPSQGGDFLYRKNSVLGGDPTMQRIDDKPAEGEQAEEEQGPEPTPAPAPDEAPRPSIDLDMDDESHDLSLDSESDDPTDELSDDMATDELEADALEAADGEDLVEDEPGSDAAPTEALQWHAPSKRSDSSVKQVRFRGD